MTTRSFIDISVAISPSLPIWPGDPQIALAPASQIATGDPVNVTRLTLGTHAGTHLDAPRHCFDDGDSVDDVPLERLIGPCWVCDLTGVAQDIESEDLERAGIPTETVRLLLKTRNSWFWQIQPGTFVEEFVALAPSGAQWMVERGVQLVGIDYASVEPFNGDGTTHRALLGNRVLALENLDLRAVSAGWHTLYCLPLKVAGGDGAPARAVVAPLDHGGAS